MTREQYSTCYNTGTHLTAPYGELVESYALGLLGHRDAAQRIREWVYEQGFELTADIDIASPTELWPSLRNFTRELCITMLKLPEEENPLAQPDSGSLSAPTTKLEMFYQLLRKVPFDCKRVLLLSYLFEESKEQISYILDIPLDEIQVLMDRGNAELGVAFLNVSVS